MAILVLETEINADGSPLQTRFALLVNVHAWCKFNLDNFLKPFQYACVSQHGDSDHHEGLYMSCSWRGLGQSPPESRA